MVLEYYSVIKKNEIMQLVATRMELEVCAPSEASQEKDKYDITYMESETRCSKLIYETETDS